MDNLLKYVRTVHEQISNLLSPSKAEPTEEELHGYAAKVILSLNNMTAKAPAAVKEKVEKAFGTHWNVKDNVAGPDGITALKLQASFKFLMDELEKMAPKIQAAPKAPANKKTFTGEKVTETKTLPDEKLLGRILGGKGATKKSIEESSDCVMTIAGAMVSLTGPKDGVEVGMKAIDEIIQKGFSSHIMGPDFQEAEIKVQPERVADLVGKAGVTIQTIKENCEVEISVTNSQKGASKGKGPKKKAIITFGGSRKGVELAKEVVNAILNVHHHPLTHPNKVHEEVEVKEHQYKFIIGRKGSEIKHMQNSFNVSVYIPNENSSHAGVLVVGEQRDVETCKRHIDNLLWKAENRPGRGDNYGADGEYYEEEEQEDWMKQYMYSRS